ncbi:MAG TPA: hypothetical protein VKE40_19995 [Gemmataceae bacterium]|nr:hypothetical protein [Gemmataceae bacterium]
MIAQPAKGIRPPADVLARYQAPAIYIAPIPPAALRYLSQPAVQAELDLSAKQKDMVGKLASLWDIPLGEWRERTPRWVPVTAFPAVIAERTDAFLVDGLTQEQQKRLNQVVYQLKAREFGAHAAFAMAARELQLRPDQSEDLDNIKASRVEGILKAVTSAERFQKVKTKVEATNGDTFDKMAEMLTRTQRERLKELKGKPFGGKVDFAEIGRPASSLRYPAELFGVYDFEIRYLSSGVVWDELKVTVEQMPSLQKAIDTWNSDYDQLKGTPVERALQLHDKTAKALDDLLTPEQRKRFDQLMARRRLSAIGKEAACGYPPVVAALKISPIQLNQLKEGKSAGDVLTRTQADALDQFFGRESEPVLYVVDPVLSRFGGRKRLELPRPFAFAQHFLIRSNRLNLSADQVKKLEELAEDEPKVMELIQKELGYPDVQNVVGAGRGAVTADAVREKYKAVLEDQCWNVLDPRQQSLAKQLFGRRK